MLECLPFAPGERFSMMWGCCAGTHASRVWQNNGNDYYAGAGTVCVAPIGGTIVRAGVPGIGQGERVGIQGATHAAYMAHMKGLRVKVGDKVKAGDPVGVVWDFAAHNGIPDHLHFSMARGNYDSGAFADPWKRVQGLALHISGRVYEAPKKKPTPSVPPMPRIDPNFYVEDLPAQLGGSGPDVFGPWANTPGHKANRDETVDRMRKAGRLAVPMNDRIGDLYIYVYRQGTYGNTFRFGPWSSSAAAEKAQGVLVSGGRIEKPRRYAGRANSLYPWL